MSDATLRRALTELQRSGRLPVLSDEAAELLRSRGAVLAGARESLAQDATYCPADTAGESVFFSNTEPETVREAGAWLLEVLRAL